MNIGMLWFDNEPTDLYGKVQRAVDYYLQKYGKVPNRCFVHPSMLPQAIPGQPLQELHQVGPVELVGHKAVRVNHFWLGVEEVGQ